MLRMFWRHVGCVLNSLKLCLETWSANRIKSNAFTSSIKQTTFYFISLLLSDENVVNLNFLPLICRRQTQGDCISDHNVSSIKREGKSHAGTRLVNLFIFAGIQHVYFTDQSQFNGKLREPWWSVKYTHRNVQRRHILRAGHVSSDTRKQNKNKTHYMFC